METKNKDNQIIKTGKKRSFKDFKNNKPLFIGGIVIIVLLIVYLIGVGYFNHKFSNGTYINNINVGGLSKDEANKKISKSVSDHQITLVFNDGNSEVIESANLGISYNENNSVGKVLKKQNSFGWIIDLFTTRKNTVNDVIQINDEALTQGINSLEHLKSESQVAPTDAFVQYANGDFSIAKETYGSTINFESLFNSVKTAIASGENEVNVEKVKGYVLPNLYDNSEELKNKLATAKSSCLSSITYTTKTGDTMTLDGGVMLDWLTRNDDGTYTKNDDTFKSNVESFVKKLANNYDTMGQTRTFNGSDGASHTVSGGTYGKRITQSEEVSAVLELIKNNKSEENRTPITTGQDASGENGGLGNTYVEVNITKQHLWFYKNGTLVVESDLVSGLESDPDRSTPSGTYYVYYKQRNRVLRGTKLPNGKWPYETPVKYWMPFNKGIGLHDLNRSKYGGNVYLTNGSHGCINLPESVAATIYGSIEVNTPVVVFR